MTAAAEITASLFCDSFTIFHMDSHGLKMIEDSNSLASYKAYINDLIMPIATDSLRRGGVVPA